MATLTASVSLVSSAADAISDALSFTATKAITLATNGDIIQQTHSIPAGFSAAIEILDASDFAGPVMMYVKNIHGTDVDAHLLAATGTAAAAGWMKIKQGEFALFPWDNNVDLFAAGAGGVSTLEVMIFELTD